MTMTMMPGRVLMNVLMIAAAAAAVDADAEDDAVGDGGGDDGCSKNSEFQNILDRRPQ